MSSYAEKLGNNHYKLRYSQHGHKDEYPQHAKHVSVSYKTAGLGITPRELRDCVFDELSVFQFGGVNEVKCFLDTIKKAYAKVIKAAKDGDLYSEETSETEDSDEYYSDEEEEDEEDEEEVSDSDSSVTCLWIKYGAKRQRL